MSYGAPDSSSLPQLLAIICMFLKKKKKTKTRLMVYFSHLASGHPMTRHEKLRLHSRGSCRAEELS
jgi:hypothetical protein